MPDSGTPFGELLALEKMLLASINRARSGQSRSAKVCASGQEGILRGDFLAWLLGSPPSEAVPALAYIDLSGAKVLGGLHFAGTRLTVTPRFFGCQFDDVIDLTNATIVGFELIACTVKRIEADRLTATGQFHLRAINVRDPGTFYSLYKERRPTVIEYVRLCGANIRGNLDLRGAFFRGTQVGSQSPIPLFAHGIVVGGNALLSDGFRAIGEIRLNGCDIERNLDLTSAILWARADSKSERILALSAAGGKVSGSVYMRRAPEWSPVAGSRFSSRGTIRLTGTNISGELDCEGGSFESPVAANMTAATDQDDLRKYAIEADAISVAGDALLGNGLASFGELHLINAKFLGDLDCSLGRFDHPGDDALVLDGVSVTGTTYLGTRKDAAPTITEVEKAQTNGFIRAPYANFRQGLDMRGFSFQVPAPPAGAMRTGLQPRGICGLYAPFAVVAGSFRFDRIQVHGVYPDEARRIVGVRVNLSQTKVDELRDSKDSWESIAPLDVTGFEYKVIGGLKADESWRWKKLDKSYCDRVAFQPQPYLWLAKINQQAGYDAAATKIRIHLEENRTRYGDFGFVKLVWRYTLAWTIRYGYRPFHAVLWLIGWSILSTVFFWDLPTSGQAVSAKPTTQRVQFNAFFFALDTLVPIVDLHQKNQWTIEPPTLTPCIEALHHSNGDTSPAAQRVWHAFSILVVRFLGVANPFIGWALTTLFAAGVSGLVSRGKGDG